MDAVADQQHRAQATRAKQPLGFPRVLERVVRAGLDQHCRLRHAASQRRMAHDFGFGDRPGAAAREHQKRGRFLLKQLQPAVETPRQRRRGAAAEHDDGVGSLRPGLAHSV